MKIATIETSMCSVPLTRPYTIALKVTSAVDMLLLRVTADDGTVGLGSASPEPQITGETLAMCRAALEPADLRWLIGKDVEHFGALASRARELHRNAPGACAALDMALHDLRAQQLGVPVVDMLGRVHEELPTSITIGIKPLRETLEEAGEYLARGFRCLKVKIGKSLTEDILRVVRLRDLVGPDVALRVDANQGYRPAELLRFLHDTAGLGIELVEQPLPPSGDDALRLLPDDLIYKLAADESVMDERDAARLADDPRPYGTFVIKLMKCGGIAPALQIAAIAEHAGIDLMWGCMDESVIGISAALHAAFACSSTRYLDLDGSFDLAQDFARGGFELRNGMLRTLDLPGLGVTLAS